MTTFIIFRKILIFEYYHSNCLKEFNIFGPKQFFCRQVNIDKFTMKFRQLAFKIVEFLICSDDRPMVLFRIVFGAQIDPLDINFERSDRLASRIDCSNHTRDACSPSSQVSATNGDQIRVRTVIRKRNAN